MKNGSLAHCLLPAIAALVICLTFGSGARAQTLPLVRVGIVPADDATPLVYAVRRGWFRQAGIDVEIMPSTGGAVIAAAVLSHAFDIGNGSFSTIINAHLHDVPLEMIAAQATYDERTPYGQFVVSSDSSYRRAKELAGKTIGAATLNDLDSLAVQAWLDKNGADSKSLRFIEVPQSAARAAVVEHRIDGTVMRHPVLAAAIASGEVRAVYPIYSAIAASFVFGGYSTSKDYAEAHPDIVRTFAQVLYRSAAYTNAHPADTVQMMADFTKLPATTIEHMVRVKGSTSLKVADMQPVIDVAAKYGAIPRSFPASDLLQYAPKL